MRHCQAPAGRQCQRALHADGEARQARVPRTPFAQARPRLVAVLCWYRRNVKQAVRFCVTPDGVRLAYAATGSGPPIVRVATWLTHLEFDSDSPVWRHWLDGLGHGRTLVRYDERGCGLSDREVGDPDVDTWVADLETVADAAELDRFALLGMSQGAAIALAYAAQHPNRVTHLILYGGWARGRQLRGPGGSREQQAIVSAIRAGWPNPNPTFRRLLSLLFLPGGTPEQMAWYDDLLWRSTTAETAARLFEARGRVNVVDLASQVRTKTLVVHARDDRAVPVEEGRLLAALIPGARLVLLDSPNHILLANEPAWPILLAEVDAFLGTERPTAPSMVDQLSPRELEVLELVAAGLTNEAIADSLSLSVRTVERHLSNVYAKLGLGGKAARAAAAAAFAHHDSHSLPRA